MLELRQTVRHEGAARYLAGLTAVLAQVSPEELSDAIDVLLQARALRRRVYVMGNGGSAATASHFVCDLVKTAHVPPYEPLRAHALTVNVPLMTALANDLAYEGVFAEQIEALVEPGDVVIAISVSGNSPNVLSGLMAAKRNGARTIGMLGFAGGAANQLVDFVIQVPCDDYGLVEDTHLAIGHAITSAIRSALQIGGGS